MNKLYLIFAIFTITLLGGCVKNDNLIKSPDDQELINFDWKTTKTYKIEVKALNDNNSPIYIYNSDELIASGYTPFSENLVLSSSVNSLKISTLPINTTSKVQDNKHIWPSGEVVSVALSDNTTATVRGLLDMHDDIFSIWSKFNDMNLLEWPIFVDHWNNNYTEVSSIILFEDKKPFTDENGDLKVEHECLWSDCNYCKSEKPGYIKYSGTYIFEDLFPHIGDYDMNDAVVEEFVETRLKKNNKLESSTFKYKINAIGCGTDLALAMYMPTIEAKHIKSIDMYFNDGNGNESPYSCTNTSGLFNINRYGFEVNNNNEVVIPLCENIKSLVKQTSFGTFFNTSPNGGKGAPVIIRVEVVYKADSDIDPNNLTDLFIMPKREEYSDWRGHEIHCADSKPTSKMNKSLFGLGNTIKEGNVNYGTFRSYNGHVWAIYIPITQFKHPIENEKNRPNKISDAYPDYEKWIMSSGENNLLWYKFPTENRVWQW